MIVTSLPDADADLLHDYNEIFICAHTADQKNYPLVLNCPFPTDAKLLRIVRFRNPD